MCVACKYFKIFAETDTLIRSTGYLLTCKLFFLNIYRDELLYGVNIYKYIVHACIISTVSCTDCIRLKRVLSKCSIPSLVALDIIDLNVFFSL